jgi:hypothetical protein
LASWNQALNMAAFRRQNKADNAKNEAKRALEAPHATALLLRYCPTDNCWSIKSFDFIQHSGRISVMLFTDSFQMYVK